MRRNLAIVLGAASLVVAAGAVVLAGPLTSNPAVSLVPAFSLDLPAILLSIAR
jgi:hypothetical protein